MSKPTWISCIFVGLLAVTIIAGCGGQPGTSSSDGSRSTSRASGNGDETAADGEADTDGATAETDGATDDGNGGDAVASAPAPSTGSGSSTSGGALGSTELEAPEAGWGHLAVRFVYDGTPPKQDKLKVDKDIEVCTKEHPLNESLVVNSENGGVRDVLVWVYLSRGDSAPKVHTSYDESAKEAVVLDNKLCRFEPHVCLVWTKQKLEIKNSDPMLHNTKADLTANAAFNDSIPAGGSVVKQFSEAERLPMSIGCNVHTWMTGKILIQDHPYMAASDEDGLLIIKNLPVGKWTFQFHHTRYVSNVAFTGGKTDGRGRVEIEIKSQVNDLGVMKLKPEQFE